MLTLIVCMHFIRLIFIAVVDYENIFYNKNFQIYSSYKINMWYTSLTPEGWGEVGC